MKVRGKKLTRKQKEALSAAGWDCTAYLWVRDIPNGMVLLNKDTGKTIIFWKVKGGPHGTEYLVAGHRTAAASGYR